MSAGVARDVFRAAKAVGTGGVEIATVAQQVQVGELGVPYKGLPLTRGMTPWLLAKSLAGFLTRNGEERLQTRRPDPNGTIANMCLRIAPVSSPAKDR